MLTGTRWSDAAACIVLAGLFLVAESAEALDHKNLDEGRPLRLEDPYPVAAGEWAFEAGAGVTLARRGSDRGVLAAELLYGAVPNLQLGIGTGLSTDPQEMDEPARSGDVAVSVLYNLNQETLSVPALGAKLTVGLPTGVDSSGVDVEVKALVTKSIDRLSLHLNAGYTFVGGARADERDGLYAIAVGASYPIGAPRYTRTALIGDVFTEQGARRGEPNVVGIEVGFRHQLTSRVVVDAGLGSELAGPADRAAFYATVGVSYGF